MKLIVVLALALSDSPDASQPRAVVERAFQAQGGLDKLKGASSSRIQGSFDNGGNQFEGEVHSQSGGKLRLNLNFKNEGERILVLQGSKGWLKTQGITQDIDDEMQGRLKISSHVDRVCGLTALIKKKNYALSSLGESMLEGKPVQGVKVTYPEMPDVQLFFDKETGLLAKLSYHTKAAFENREELRETYFREYRVLDFAAEDEKIVKQAGLESDGLSLLSYLQENTPDESARRKIKDLIGQLGDAAFAKRERASAELAQWGMRAASLLREARRSSDPEIARRAENCLKRLRNDPAAKTAAAVARLVAQRKPANAAETLLNYLPWAPDEAAVREIQEALVATVQSTTSPDPVLLNALKDSDPLRRKAALIALGKDGGEYLKSPGRRLRAEGVRLPFHVVFHRDGRKDMEYRTVHIEFFNRFDDSIFQRPD